MLPEPRVHTAICYSPLEEPQALGSSLAYILCQIIFLRIFLKQNKALIRFGINMDTRLYFKWINNGDLLYSKRNSAQCYVAAWMGGKFGGESLQFSHSVVSDSL